MIESYWWLCEDFNEEQIISGCPIDGAISVQVDGGFGSFRWFVYITMLLLRDASWILILHCGTPEPPQRHLYYKFCWNLIPICFINWINIQCSSLGNCYYYLLHGVKYLIKMMRSRERVLVLIMTWGIVKFYIAVLKWLTFGVGPVAIIMAFYTNNEWLWVQWYRYFHEVRDGMFYSTRQSRVE